MEVTKKEYEKVLLVKNTALLLVMKIGLKFQILILVKIFRQIDRSNKILEKLSDKAVALILKWRAEKAGIDSQKLAGHSMRSGIATVLAKEGATENEIKK